MSGELLYSQVQVFNYAPIFGCNLSKLPSDRYSKIVWLGSLGYR